MADVMDAQAGPANVCNRGAPGLLEVDRASRHPPLEHQRLRFTARKHAPDQGSGLWLEMQNARHTGLGHGTDDLAALQIDIGPAPVKQLGLARAGVHQQLYEHAESAIAKGAGAGSQTLQFLGSHLDPTDRLFHPRHVHRGRAKATRAQPPIDGPAIGRAERREVPVG
jgi:hypothetical protein